jgi:hypothetical protein
VEVKKEVKKKVKKEVEIEVNGVNEVSGLTASKLTTIVRRCIHQQSFVEPKAITPNAVITSSEAITSSIAITS